MICFLLTAGEGRRLRPTTEKHIKPSLPFLNLPLAYYGFYLAKKAGFQNFLMNKHHLPDQVDQLAKNLREYTDSVETVDETAKLLGSGGALWNARKILQNNEHFLVANGDEVLFPQNDQVIKHLVESHKNSGALCTLLTCDHPDLLKSLKPVWINNQNEVQGFGMEPINSQSKPVHYTGYKIFSRRIFDYLPEGESNIFYDVVKNALTCGEKVKVMSMDKAVWHETGNFASFIKASLSVAVEQLEAVNRRLDFFGKSRVLCSKGSDSFLVAPKSFDTGTGKNWKGFIGIGENSLVNAETQLENVIVNSNIKITAPGPFKNQFIMEDDNV